MESISIANEPRPIYRDAHLTIDFSNGAVAIDSSSVLLTAKEYALLAFLAEHPGEILRRETLLSSVWGYSPQIRTRTLDVHLARLRRKLGSFGHSYIETVFGSGCRFQPSVPRVVAAGIRSVA
jgi:DNA-binding response OmpR family regulator